VEGAGEDEEVVAGELGEAAVELAVVDQAAGLVDYEEREDHPGGQRGRWRGGLLTCLRPANGRFRYSAWPSKGRMKKLGGRSCSLGVSRRLEGLESNAGLSANLIRPNFIKAGPSTVPSTSFFQRLFS
jgi:hypothetical protein